MPLTSDPPSTSTDVAAFDEMLAMQKWFTSNDLDVRIAAAIVEDF